MIWQPIKNTIQYWINRRDDYNRIAKLDTGDRMIDSVIIHHSASSIYTTVEQIRQWHLARGFSDIGYHLLIDYTGALHFGRPLKQAGAHCLNHNAHSIGICLVGYYEPDGSKYFREPTDALLNCLKFTVEGLCHARDLDVQLAVQPHRHYKNTACPGQAIVDQMKGWWG